MKSRLISLFVFLSIISSAFAQLPVDNETGKVVFTDVIHIKEMNKDEIYNKAKTWIVSTLKSGDNMVELNGTNSNQIVATGNIIIPDKEINDATKVRAFRQYVLNFKFIIYCKDNRFKYSVQNFDLSFRTPYEVFNTGLIEIIDKSKTFGKKKQQYFEKAIKESTKKNIDNLVNDLIRFMNKKEEEW
ncbi:MAG: DUF4468 domain-containing protein [Bacteroidales bacterium]|jgi:hypothetical protein|nr:DUF4468 domain-containing protein [Bacteroidales bacterium]